MDKLNVLGRVALVVGLGASLMSAIVGEKKTERRIDQKVNMALASREKKEKKEDEVIEAEVVKD